MNHDISKKLKLDIGARITDRIIRGGGTSGSSQLRIKNIVTARPTNGIADELDFDSATNDGSDDYQEFLLSLVNPITGLVTGAGGAGVAHPAICAVLAAPNIIQILVKLSQDTVAYHRY